MVQKKMTMDGNMAAAYVSYAFTETAGIYPITPSSDMAEHTDAWAASGKKNIFGGPVKVVEMQSEGGASGVVHGALQAGSLTSTYTASQGLLLMLPNMYKIAGELLPGVFHVSARQIATHALSIFGEHSDIYAARPTGVAILAAGSVQEVMDLGAVAHLAAIKGRMPFIHFFDGFRTSHEIQKIDAWDYEDLKGLVDYKALDKFRKNSLNPETPCTRGTAQNPDIYFQAREANSKYYDAIPGIVEEYMNKVNKLTGKSYGLFEYYGAANADNVIIAMGSVTETIRETIDYVNGNGKNVGLLAVHLYRPFSAEHFLNSLPKSVKKIAVLDRTKEPGSTGEPLYLDVRSVLFDRNDITVVGGRYGLSSKDTTSEQIIAVYENLEQGKSKDQFTIGINDDLNHTSLALGSKVDTIPTGTHECKFYGLGADGTVGANKNSIKIIGDNTDMYAQGYFAYDSKKSGGITISHLRFGKEKIRSTYLVNNPSFVSCSTPSYLNKYDMLKGLKSGGTFLLNSLWNENEIEGNLPNGVKKQLAEKKINFYTINATKIAVEIGLGGRTNTIMQSAFFKLTNVIPFTDAVKYMKEAITKTYSNKGENIVTMNHKAVDEGAERLVAVKVDPSWANLKASGTATALMGVDDEKDPELKKFLKEVVDPMSLLAGDDLPVSLFVGREDGTFPNGTTAFEKRGIAVNVPEWKAENCIQCNQCSYVCPHAAIRPFLISDEELKGAPSDIKTIKPVGKVDAGLNFRIQVSTLDCTGCNVCAEVCPSKEKSLVMKSLESQKAEVAKWDYISKNVKYRDTFFKKTSVKGSQFAKPLFEFSGACAGCGETPYIKAVTQLYGDRMIITNATGCSSIYGGSAPATPYCTNDEGHGPAWANSLFEDNAEYGAGISFAINNFRTTIERLMVENMEKLSSDLKSACNSWIDNKEEGDGSKEATAKLIPLLEKDQSDFAKEVLGLKQYLIKKSMWVFGGDGWAYDIGYGGLDHVLSTGEDINMLVLDTEVYSNTGGQSSKASQTGSIAKFAAAGKPLRKKDLGRMAMTYGYVYVAQVSMGASQAHFMKVLAEAERYKGPSLIIAYSPCIAHGLKCGMGGMIDEEKRAVTTGYWHLYRYDPRLEEEGKNPYVLDSKAPDFEQYLTFLRGEVRYSSLEKSFPERADKLFTQALDDAKWRYNNYKRLAEMDYSN